MNHQLALPPNIITPLQQKHSTHLIIEIAEE